MYICGVVHFICSPYTSCTVIGQLGTTICTVVRVDWSVQSVESIRIDPTAQIDCLSIGVLSLSICLTCATLLGGGRWRYE